MSMPFDAQPRLRGSLVELRPLQAGDFGALFAVAADPLIWEQHPDNDRWKPEVFREFFDQAMASGGALLAVETETGAVIGSSRYHDYSEERSEVEIGWSFLARRCWGGAYNGEMKDLMLRHAFQQVERVVFLVGLTNFRSQQAVLKIGGVPAGRRRNASGRESLAFEITAAAYLESAEKRTE